MHRFRLPKLVISNLDTVVPVSEVKKEQKSAPFADDIREGSEEETPKKKKGKKADTEIAKGQEGVTKANQPKGKALDKEEEVEDGCGCDHKSKKKGKKDAAINGAVIKRGDGLTAGDFRGDACWAGYVQKGMKMKGSKRVPNCVPAGAKKKKDSEVEAKKKDGYKGKSVWADGYALDACTLSADSIKLATDSYKKTQRKPAALSSKQNRIIAGTFNT